MNQPIQENTIHLVHQNNFRNQQEELVSLPNIKYNQILLALMQHLNINKAAFQKQNFPQFEQKLLNFKDKQKENQSQNSQKIWICSQADQNHKYGSEFNHRLDPRDQLMEHKFNFSVIIDCSKLKEEKEMKEKEKDENKNKFEDSTAFKPLCNEIRIYLVQLMENITSVSFNLLNERKLTDSETKDFASKNILMNVNILFKKIMQNVQLKNIVKDKEILNFIDEQKYEQTFKKEICQFIDETLKGILQNIISYYPQAAIAGASPKLKSNILNIDRNDNQQLDLLMVHKLKIQRKQNGDYTEYIMRVMNKIIQIPNYFDKTDPLQETLYQKFVNFNQTLFWMSKQKQLEDYLPRDMFSQKTIQAQEEKVKKLKQAQINKQLITKYLKKEKLSIIQQNMDKKIRDKLNNNKSYQFMLFDQKIQQTKEDNINKMRKNHDFSINKKLPNSIEPFSQKSMKTKDFSVSNSSMLRILTKWAQNLIHIFQHPQAYTVDRIYPFKNIKHQMFHATQNDKLQLYQQIKKKKKEMQQFRDNLISNNTVFQSIFLNANNQQFTKLVKRYTQTRMLASNINNLLIQLMKQFVSKLIHLLIEAGTIRYEDNKIQYEIDLVVLRLGDLMRAKVYCTESSFISLLKTLYILDQQKMKRQENSENKQEKIKQEKCIPDQYKMKIKQLQLLKLVRIKNKLNTKDNNILINYVFMGQIQCELQMSVQRMQHKQQNFNDFNHFLYQIIRGKFGVLSECATIIAQHDPIVAADGSNNTMFKPKEKKHVKKKQIKKQKGQLFICSSCKQLKQNKTQFLKYQKSNKCDQCRIKQAKDKQSLLKDEKLKTVIDKLKQGNHVESVAGKTYKQLKQLIYNKNQIQCNNSSLLISVMAGSSELNFEMLGYLQCQSTLYTSTLKPENLNKDKPVVTDLINLTPFVQKQKKLPHFTYIAKSNIKQVIANSKFKNVKTIQEKIKLFKLIVQNQIMDKAAVSRVKNKIENLVFKSKQQLDIFGKMINNQTKGNLKDQNKGNLGSIEFIFSQQFNISKLPEWIGQCSKLKILDVRLNQITDILILKECDKITELYLSYNPIKQIKFDVLKSSWQNLIVLMLSGNFQQLKFCQLQNLTTLQIESCKSLKNIQLKEWPQLQTLKISNNISLPSLQLKKFPKLQTLDILSNKQLTSLKLQDWQQLQTLKINNNQKLASFSLKEWPQLQTLNISKNNSFDSLKLQKWPQLQTLKISNNKKLLSLQLKQWTQLQTLNISENTSLTSLQLKEWPQLQILDIYNNKLSSLSIPNLPQILVFDLQNNSYLSQLNVGPLPKLLKLNMLKLTKLQVDKIDWNLNDEVNFVGDNKIWQSIKQKQPSLNAKRLKQWNNSWNNLQQLQKQGQTIEEFNTKAISNQ